MPTDFVRDLCARRAAVIDELTDRACRVDPARIDALPSQRQAAAAEVRRLKLAQCHSARYCAHCSRTLPSVAFLHRDIDDRIVWSLRCRTCQARYKEALQQAFASAGEFSRMVAAQGGTCLACRQHHGAGLTLDLCPYTDIVRGLVCGLCAAGAELVDNPELWRRVVAHVRGASSDVNDA